MPRYDYRCAAGHIKERIGGFNEKSVRCRCGLTAQRLSVYREQYLGGDGITAHRPTREAPVNITRFTEAHGEVLRDAEKAGTTAPDLLRVAQERVKRGDVLAIE